MIKTYLKTVNEILIKHTQLTAENKSKNDNTNLQVAKNRCVRDTGKSNYPAIYQSETQRFTDT